MERLVKASLQSLMLTFSDILTCNHLPFTKTDVSSVPVAPGTNMFAGSDR